MKADETEKTQAEVEVRPTNSYVAPISTALASLLSEAVWVGSPDLREIEYVNPAFERLFRRTSAEVQESPSLLIDSVHPDDRDGLLALLADESEGGTAVVRVARPDGSERRVEVSGFSSANGTDGEMRTALCRDIDQRVENEVLVAQAGRMARIGGWELDLATSQLASTPSLLEIFEVQEDDDPSLASSFDYFLPEDQAQIAGAIQQALDDGVPWDFTLRAITSKGNPIHVRSSGHPVIVDGQTVRLAGFVQDVTERIEGQAELARTEALLADAARMAQLGGWDFEVDTMQRVWSKHVYDIFELPAGETPGLADVVKLYHPDDQPLFAAAVQEAIDDGVPYDLELRAITAKGNPIHVRASGHPVVVDGRTVRLSGFVQDITGRVQQKSALARSQALLVETGRVARLGGWELDARTLERTWTNTLLEIYEVEDGKPPSIAEGMDFYHPEDQPVIEAAVQGALTKGVPYDLELRAVTGRGNRIQVRTGGQAEYEDGQVVRIWGFVQDITERARQREQLREAFIATIEAMVRAIETRDPYTAVHQRNVSQLGAEIARGLGLSQDIVNGVFLGSMIHDIGKVAVPSQILNKPGRLTGVEFEMVKTHSQVGFEILAEIDFPWPVAEIVLQHHERLDGSGYPNGLKGDEISQLAQIVAVADVVEAMSAHRPYRPALGLDRAVEEITKNRGVLYDPEVVDVCVRLIREEGFEFDDR